MEPNNTNINLMSDAIERAIAANGIDNRVTGAMVTRRIIRFHLQVALGVTVKRIQALSGDIANALGCESVNVSRSRGLIDIEYVIPGGEILNLTELLDGEHVYPDRSGAMVLGADGTGYPFSLRMNTPQTEHILITGQHSSGKTTLLRSMLASAAARNTPDDLVIMLVSPKPTELMALLDFQHASKYVITDESDVLATLKATVEEMYRRTISSQATPRIIVAIDGIDEFVQRIGQPFVAQVEHLTRSGAAAGIHIIATANELSMAMSDFRFPVRIAGQVRTEQDAFLATGMADSNAEKLNGNGDFLVVYGGEAVRIQAATVSDDVIGILASEVTVDASEPVQAVAEHDDNW